jgi:DNA replication protein DnaC
MMNWDDFCKHNKIGSRFHDVKVDHFENDPGLFYVSESLVETEQSFIFHGSPGAGKTHFVLSVIRKLISLGAEIRWLQATEFEDKIISCKREFGDAKYFIETCSDCDFLFIDDFGTERATEDLGKEWYQLINYRWSNAKQTVFTTNLNREEVLKNYGKRIYSRFKDFEWVEFTGPDLRGKR